MSDGFHLRVGISPMQAIWLLMVQAKWAPQHLPAAFRHTLHARARTVGAALAPLAVATMAPPALGYPHFLHDASEFGTAALEVELERVSAWGASEIVDETLRCSGTAPPPPALRPWTQHPKRTRDRYVHAVRVFHNEVVAPLVPDLDARLRREAERWAVLSAMSPTRTVVGALAGATDNLTVAAGDRIRLGGKEVHKDDRFDRVLGRNLWFYPVVAGRRTIGFSEQDEYPDDTDYVCFAPPGLRLDETVSAPGRSALAALVGASRAAIIDELRRRPATTGELATALAIGPSTVSHHLHALHDALLVIGQRQGLHVRYQLTDLGERVAGLYNSGREVDPRA